MANERITEEIVRSHFKEDRMYRDIFFEEQKSSHLRIQKYLVFASKSGDGVGKPEFIISFKNKSLSNLVLIVECKSNVLKHESISKEKYKDYAVDGVLLYSSYLSQGYDVISIAISGEKREMQKVSTYLQLKGASRAESLNKDMLMAISDYIDLFRNNESKKSISLNELLAYSRKLNDYLHNKKIKESQRSLLISGVLIALENQPFREGYKLYDDSYELSRYLATTISNQLRRSGLQEQKIENLDTAFSFIKSHPSLSEESTTLKHIISQIETEILIFIKNNNYYDALGQFYIEFLRYANSDKGLGIVLTPPHITSLMADLVFADKNSVVFDNCTGTGGFLISAMSRMIDDAAGDSIAIESIKRNQLIGIEYQEDILALAISNMFIHGDGKSNIYGGDCFDETLIKKIGTSFKPNAGLLNPPYKTQKNDKEELEFLFNNLNILERGSYCAAIIPISIVLAKKGIRYELKKKLLKEHTLVAVLSMPDELFLNSHANVITCIVVIKAKIPHKNVDTYLGYWKDDGFIRLKNRGRVDSGRWTEIRKIWIDSYTNKKCLAGLSIMKKLSAGDEWCAEAHMPTDYSLLKRLMFEESIKKFSTYLFFNELVGSLANEPVITSSLNKEEINVVGWSPFMMSDLFFISRGKDKAIDTLPGNVPLVMATRENNGVAQRVASGKRLFHGNQITIVSNGASTGEAFVQLADFFAGVDVAVLTPKNQMSVYTMFFICEIIKMESYRFSYGRKWTTDRISTHFVPLPVTENGCLDYDFMDSYVKTSKFSVNIHNYLKKENKL